MNALKALKKNAPRSNEPDESGRMNVMQFFPRRVLRETFIPGNMCYTALRCPCPICVGDTTKTRKDADERTAQYIAENDGQLRILATLAFIGGTFATRLLCGTNGFNSVEEACRNIENRPPLQRDLFNRFILADRSLRLNDLQRQFQHSMLQNEQFLRTPIFQVGDPHRQFTQVQNYPFVNVQNIQVSHRTNTSCRLSSFRIYDDFCNSDLQVWQSTAQC